MTHQSEIDALRSLVRDQEKTISQQRDQIREQYIRIANQDGLIMRQARTQIWLEMQIKERLPSGPPPAPHFDYPYRLMQECDRLIRGR